MRAPLPVVEPPSPTPAVARALRGFVTVVATVVPAAVTPTPATAVTPAPAAATAAAAAAAEEGDERAARGQGITLVHFSAQLKRILWDRGACRGCLWDV